MTNLNPSKNIRVGLVGTGFVARGLIHHLINQPDMAVSAILTRRPLDGCPEIPLPGLLTHSLDHLLKNSDLVFECSGDVYHATEIISQVLGAGLPAVTFNPEFHITTGSYFVGRGLLTEAAGDQPGCLAQLKEEVLEMGFQPLVYGNLKRFLNPHPEMDDMVYWSRRQKIRLAQTVAFTDGTKVQIEQALAANGLGADIAHTGLLGLEIDDLESGARTLASAARQLGRPISDYLLSLKNPAGVFIVAEHQAEQAPYLKYLKLGDGPEYILLKNYHLVHLEAAGTIRRIINGGGILLDNGPIPRISVAAAAKQTLTPGQQLPYGIGSFELRGVAIRTAEFPGHIPIGLVQDAVVTRLVKPRQILTRADVELPDSLAVRIWDEISQQAVQADPQGTFSD